MPNSKADAAKSAPDAGTSDAGSTPRPRVGRRTSAGAPAPRNGITITRRGLALALGILGGAYMLQWDRTSGVEAQVRDLRVELPTQINGLRYLMEHNGVMWPEPPPVFIKDFGGVDEILKPGVVEAEFKESRLEALGIVVDADRDAAARWGQLKMSLGRDFAGLPDPGWPGRTRRDFDCMKP